MPGSFEAQPQGLDMSKVGYCFFVSYIMWVMNKKKFFFFFNLKTLIAGWDTNVLGVAVLRNLALEATFNLSQHNQNAYCVLRVTSAISK